MVRYLTVCCQSFIQFPFQPQCCTGECLQSIIQRLSQCGSQSKRVGWPKPLISRSESELVLCARNICICTKHECARLCMCAYVCARVAEERAGRERQREREGERERAFRRHCEPRAKANDLSGPRCTVSLR